MKYLIIVETTITEPSWVREYLVKVTPLVLKFGGKYLTRTSSVELLEGQNKPGYSLVAEFPSKESALGFYQSPEYTPYKVARQNGAQSKLILVAVENAAG